MPTYLLGILNFITKSINKPPFLEGVAYAFRNPNRYLSLYQNGTNDCTNPGGDYDWSSENFSYLDSHSERWRSSIPTEVLGLNPSQTS